MATFTLTASKVRSNGRPQALTLRAMTATPEEAQELAAIFPKSYRAHHTEVRHYDTPGRRTGMVSLEAALVPTAGNTVNEAGIKRYRAAVRKIEQAGHALEYAELNRKNHAPESWYFTREELDADLEAMLPSGK